MGNSVEWSRYGCPLSCWGVICPDEHKEMTIQRSLENEDLFYINSCVWECRLHYYKGLTDDPKQVLSEQKGFRGVNTTSLSSQHIVQPNRLFPYPLYYSIYTYGVKFTYIIKYCAFLALPLKEPSTYQHLPAQQPHHLLWLFLSVGWRQIAHSVRNWSATLVMSNHRRTIVWSPNSYNNKK